MTLTVSEFTVPGEEYLECTPRSASELTFSLDLQSASVKRSTLDISAKTFDDNFRDGGYWEAWQQAAKAADSVMLVLRSLDSGSFRALTTTSGT